ncbi:hypothetical protein GGTG_04819 [Gaeumannomyces tritici R3-111a-1]|uniref:Uncharacterized protein n=1 Tax=Gaeumannomyces tritici (strain R3-111a-1) TaxID=644352 RepID=J3NU64_GAET3|nr:hypothetical protein GGTG_04819 [Gaeumannomyces tritici R3-111a-1]EJT79735.1 hypothetical protein GGTG_04819 [Gaeumannomyces tritici R3-111a-1]
MPAPSPWKTWNSCCGQPGSSASSSASEPLGPRPAKVDPARTGGKRSIGYPHTGSAGQKGAGSGSGSAPAGSGSKGATFEVNTRGGSGGGGSAKGGSAKGGSAGPSGGGGSSSRTLQPNLPSGPPSGGVGGGWEWSATVSGGVPDSKGKAAETGRSSSYISFPPPDLPRSSDSSGSGPSRAVESLRQIQDKSSYTGSGAAGGSRR